MKQYELKKEVVNVIGNREDMGGIGEWREKGRNCVSLVLIYAILKKRI